VRPAFLPFALPDTDETEINEIAEAVRSGWLPPSFRISHFAFRISNRSLPH